MLTLLQPPEIPIVSLEEAKIHLRLDHACEDNYLLGLIEASTAYVENYLGVSLIAKTWEFVAKPKMKADGLSYIPLPNPPLLQVLSVEHLLTNGQRQPIKRYCLEQRRALPEVCIYDDQHSIAVTYRAGMGEYPRQISPCIKQAILIALAEMYENRTFAALEKNTLFHGLLDAYKVVGLR